MLIKMLKTVPGADDGITTALYKEGQTYDISERLARNFFIMKAAEETKVELPEKKNAGQAPENKMIEIEEVKKNKKR